LTYYFAGFEDLVRLEAEEQIDKAESGWYPIIERVQ
jgi:hypothetical protein